MQVGRTRPLLTCQAQVGNLSTLPWLIMPLGLPTSFTFFIISSHFGKESSSQPQLLQWTGKCWPHTIQSEHVPWTVPYPNIEKHWKTLNKLISRGICSKWSPFLIASLASGKNPIPYHTKISWSQDGLWAWVTPESLSPSSLRAAKAWAKKECVNGEQMTSFLLLTSKALVTSSDALVTTSPESRLSNKWLPLRNFRRHCHSTWCLAGLSAWEAVTVTVSNGSVCVEPNEVATPAWRTIHTSNNVRY